MHDKHVCHLADQGYGREAFLAVVGNILVQVLIRDGCADMTKQQGPAVRHGASHDLRTDIAVPSRPVLDEEVQGRRLAEDSGHDARNEVGRATGCGWYDDASTPVAGARIGQGADASQPGCRQSRSGQSGGYHGAPVNSNRHACPLSVKPDAHARRD